MAYRYKPNAALWLRFFTSTVVVAVLVYWQYGIFLSVLALLSVIAMYFLLFIFANSNHGKNTYLRTWYFKDPRAHERIIEQVKKDVN